MGLLEKIYQTADPEFIRSVWNNIPYFSPSVPLLKRRYFKQVLTDHDSSFPSKILKHTLFPGVPDLQLARIFSPQMDRGVGAFNELVLQFLPGYAPLLLMEGRNNRGFRKFLESGIKRMNTERPSLEDRAFGLNCSRTIGLGNFVGKVDTCPEVLRSLSYFEDIKNALNELLEISERPNGRFSHTWDYSQNRGFSAWSTAAGVSLLGMNGKNHPLKYRLKYLKGNQPAYSSILMKMIRKNLYAERIGDYTGCEILVENAYARRDLIDYIRNSTSLIGKLEGFEDKTKKNNNKVSDKGFRCIKFILRFLVSTKMKGPLVNPSQKFERVPIELQIYTVDEVECRDKTADHETYKRKQFFQILPALWPEEIYRPLAEARGIKL